MERRLNIAGWLTFSTMLAVVSCSPGNNDKGFIMEHPEGSGIDIKEMYREYALLRCLACGYDIDFQDISGTVYNDLTFYARLPDSGGLALYFVDSIAQSAVKKMNELKPPQVMDYEGKRPIFFGCMRFFESDELKREIEAMYDRIPVFPK